jgi:tRNA (guanine26-N2/guanine27-N2)-dimethyltransferase
LYQKGNIKPKILFILMTADLGFPVETVKEGKVKVVVPKLEAFVKKPSDYAPSKAPVFYNPVMEFNRDVAVISVRAYRRSVGHDLSICEPLTGTGVRGIRFAVEAPNTKVVVSDINEHAFKLASHNVSLNGVNDTVSVWHSDANCLLSCHAAPHERFDVVDVDPFGSPVPYVDSAVRALRDGGLIALTATDLAALCGVHQNACFRKYGGKPLHTEYCHELAVRLLSGCLVAQAAKHEMGISVVFSHASDHYVRVYATVSHGAEKANACLRQIGYVLHCFQCFHREKVFQTHTARVDQCPECGAKMGYAGPLWLGNIFDEEFCRLMAEESMHVALNNNYRISRLITLAKAEAKAPATYYVLDAVSDKLGLPVPSVDAALKLLQANGFSAFRTHFNSTGLRTNAPATVVRRFITRAAATS